MKWDYWIGIAIIAIGIVMTGMLFFMIRNPVDVECISIQEMPSKPHFAPKPTVPHDSPV